MSSSDCLPDHPLSSDLVRRLKSALDARDEETVSAVICTQVRHVDAVIELANDDWMKDPAVQLPPGVLLGLWTLEYTRELTTPLCIAAARGQAACVGHLLGRGADPNASPGGRGPLHEACLGGHTACARLLLQHCAHPDLLSAEGLAPLHLCRTAASLGLLKQEPKICTGMPSNAERVNLSSVAAGDTVSQVLLFTFLEGSGIYWHLPFMVG